MLCHMCCISMIRMLFQFLDMTADLCLCDMTKPHMVTKSRNGDILNSRLPNCQSLDLRPPQSSAKIMGVGQARLARPSRSLCPKTMQITIIWDTL